MAPRANMVDLVLFGAPRAGAAAAPSSLPAKAYATIALLVLDHGGYASRAAVAARLWDDGGGAGGSLRTLLYLIGKWERLAGVTLFRHDKANLWRDAGCASTDLDAFLAIETVADAAALERFCDLYNGELLEGVDQAIDGELVHGIRAWRHAMAERFARLALPAAERIGGLAGERALRRILRDAPHDERVLRRLLVLLSARGDVDGARREYGDLERRLLADFGTVPEVDTRALAAEILGLGQRGAAAVASADVAARFLGPSRGMAEEAAPAGKPRVLILPPGPSPYQFGRRSQLLAASFIDDVRLTLCKQRTFAVIAPHSARQIAQDEPYPDAGPSGADYVLRTRLMPADDQSVRLGLSFVRLGTKEILIGEDVRFGVDDLPSRHQEIAGSIAQRLAGTIARAEISSFRRTGSASAYVHYLLGQERMRVVELADLRRARRAFRRALELQPDFTPAISMQARTLTLEWLILGRLERDLLAEAHELAERAVEINPFEAAGHRELGHVALYMQDYDQSLELLDHARSLSPHHADILMNEADVLVHNSRAREAPPLVELAMSLNPLAPDEYYWIAATVLFFTGKYRNALETVLLMKNPEPAARLAAACAAMADDMVAARRYHAQSMARQPDFRVADWRRLIGLKAEADKDLYVEALRRAGFD